MATGVIGYSGSQYLMDGTVRSINCTLGPYEYPTSFTITNMGSNGAYWFHNSTANETFTLYLSNSDKSIYYTLGTITFNGQVLDITSNTFTVSCPNLQGQDLYIYGSGNSVQLRNQANITIGTASVTTRCGNPSGVNAINSGSGVITIAWTASADGNNNPVSSYAVIRNTSKSESGATTITTSATSCQITNSPGAGSFYYGVQARGTAGASYYSDYSWSNQVSASGHPTVSAGDLIRKVQMDALKTYLNKGNTVTLGGLATASDGNTYKSGLTAGSTVFDDSWYNNA